MPFKNKKPLPIEKLTVLCEPVKIPYESSLEIPKTLGKKPAQPRALSALSLAVKIKNNGFNIFVSGEANLGRTYMINQFLFPLAKKEATPHDLIYVNNFDNPDKPILLKLLAGQGKVLKVALLKVLQQIRKELPIRFEAESYEKKKRDLLKNYQNIKENLIKQMDKVAEKKGFNLDIDEQGSLTLYPIVKGKRLSEEDFDKLDTKFRVSLKQKGDTLLHAMSVPVRKLTQAEREFKQNQKELELEVINSVLDRFFTPLIEKNCKHATLDQKNIKEKNDKNEDCDLLTCDTNTSSFKALQEFFHAMRTDIIENIDLFLPKDSLSSFSLDFVPQAMQISQNSTQEDSMYRYDINIFVDNADTKGAPIILDYHPTYVNLLGCIERESEMGALVTNFTLIKAGSLHKAHGGYLIIHIEDLLANPSAWEGLMRALRTSKLNIEDPSDGIDLVKTKGIEPSPLHLDVKVILVGEDSVYETLLEHDDRFAKLFKIKAQMSSETIRNTTNIKAWLTNLSPIIEEANLIPFDREALAGLVDYASFLCEDHQKLSLKFPLVREAMIEASTLAQMANLDKVNRSILDKALQERIYRSSYIEELFMEEYDRNIIKIQTAGSAIGQVNALSVTSTGQFEFGLPHQISCTVGVGHGGIIDLEREAELGGPIHTKAMMILKSYLVHQFAHNKPLILTGSLCFEQSYNAIEGDSASAAELVSLLSAIAHVPVRLSLAITGAISQVGSFLPVGGVTQKIEGFFNLCNRRGLTGEQGVIIPKDNIEHLMLNQKVINAVKENKFFIFAVSHISEALELLTNMPTGKRRNTGNFPENTLFHAVDTQLHELGWLAENSFKTRKKRVQKKKNLK